MREKMSLSGTGDGAVVGNKRHPKSFWSGAKKINTKGEK